MLNDKIYKHKFLSLHNPKFIKLPSSINLVKKKKICRTRKRKEVKNICSESVKHIYKELESQNKQKSSK